MKVCIVTVYNSENCGSFMQAYALGKTIESMGHDVVFYERKRHITPPDRIHSIRRAVKTLIYRGLGKTINLLKSDRAFRRAEKYFYVTDSKECDRYIIGSDTLWNLDAEHFLEEKDKFWGKSFSGGGISSYAVSVSNTTKAKIEAEVNVKECLRRFEAISVRDQHSKNVISSFTDKQVSVVCDPTILLKKEDYGDLVKKNGVLAGNYMLIYCFVDITFSEKMKKQITDIAKQKGLKLISYGEKRDWCDKSLNYDPMTFLSVFADAELIVTNTFHGVMFSMIFEKQFVALAQEKNKIREALKKYGLEGRSANQAAELNDVFVEHINYAKVNQVVEKERKKGLEFLKKVLEGVAYENHS